MQQTIRVRITLPKCSQCASYIEQSFAKHPVLDKARVDKYSGTVEFTWDDKKNPSIDKYKFEKELQSAIKDLGYSLK